MEFLQPFYRPVLPEISAAKPLAATVAELAPPPIVLAAIPIFVVLILLEAAWTRKTPAADTAVNAATGALSVIFDGVVGHLQVVPYCWLYARLPSTGGAMAMSRTDWAIQSVELFVLVEFCYWAFHWMAHVTAFGWWLHSTHHSSEEMNLSVSLRQGAAQSLMSAWFFVLPCVLGFHPLLFLIQREVNTVYQFFLHTEVVHRLPWALELVFNTPSHHRVHHGRNQRDLDCNYGGTLVVFDRLFGTFVPELPGPPSTVYGLVHPARSTNPAWLNLAYGFEIARRCRLHGWRGAVYSPAWKAGPAPVVTRATAPRWDPEAGTALSLYALTWLGLTMPLVVAFDGSGLPFLVGSIVILPSLLMWRRRWLWTGAELVRLAAAPRLAGMPPALCAASAIVLVALVRRRAPVKMD